MYCRSTNKCQQEINAKYANPFHQHLFLVVQLHITPQNCHTKYFPFLCIFHKAPGVTLKGKCTVLGQDQHLLLVAIMPKGLQVALFYSSIFKSIYSTLQEINHQMNTDNSHHTGSTGIDALNRQFLSKGQRTYGPSYQSKMFLIFGQKSLRLLGNHIYSGNAYIFSAELV